MNCLEVQKFVYTYLDGEFEGREKAEFEAHLAICPSCRDAVERDASFRDAIQRHLSSPPTDTALRQRLQLRLDQSARPHTVARSWEVPLALAASMALALLGWRTIQSFNDAPLDSPTFEHAPTLAAAHLNPNLQLPSDPNPSSPNAIEKTKIHEPTTASADRDLRALRAQAKAALTPASPSPKLAPSMRPAARGDEIELVAHTEPAMEVLGGGVDANFLLDKSPFGAVRSPHNLRAIIRAHVRQLPPEVQGTAQQVQRFLRERLPFVSAPPIAEGVGVRLQGARLTQIAGHPVVQYYYSAFDKDLTAFRFVAQAEEQPFNDPEVQRSSPGDPRGQLSGMVADRLAGYTVLNALRGDELICLVSELDVDELKNLIQEPTSL